ncbi:type II toxin-antitoxin system VapC family toxin [Nocardioides humi]|uniref:Ribonuclease VapC n=1 Tax=Nocardioides humi TaxID=449461 RepID=A0ABN2BBS2_9ACTN|nr:PIN domain-containing protein [Nocardioides humi]
MILCDTGPLVAAAVRHDPDHHACVELLTGLRLARRQLLVPATVVAEVGYMLDSFGSSRLEARFLASLAAGDFDPVDVTTDDYARMAELVEQYDDLRIGTTDASVIALAERLDITEVATLDRRHFTAVRPQHVEALTLLPERL